MKKLTLNPKKITSVFKKTPILIVKVVLILLFVNIASFVGLPEPIEGNRVATVREKLKFDTVKYVYSIKNDFKNKLVSEVDSYISRMAPESEINPELLVRKCLEYETDISFVIAQGMLESHMGTRGKAAKTNSVWNVGTYDNGKILYTYNNPNESIDPYLSLIKRNYLTNVTSKGDTIYKNLHNLLEDRGYVNYEGNRFASAKNYEDGLRKLMIRINNETQIKFFQEVVNLPKDDLLVYFSSEEFFIPSNDFEKLYTQKFD